MLLFTARKKATSEKDAIFSAVFDRIFGPFLAGFAVTATSFV